MSEPSEIRVNIPFRGRQLAEFLAIKDYLGIHTNADVVRYLVHRHARALQRRKTAARPSARPTVDGRLVEQEKEKPVAERARNAAGARAAPSRKGATPEHVCLECPLPECDEGDPRCPYQHVTGERERQRARTRAYMRRVRAK